VGSDENTNAPAASRQRISWPARRFARDSSKARKGIPRESAALNGDQYAITEIGNRMDGKPPQAVVGDDEADAIKVAVTRVENVIIDPKCERSESISTAVETGEV
jgi:hypothetical protein